MRHPLKVQKRPKFVLVSSCGFWELDNFDPIIAHIRDLAANLSGEFCGALLHPHAPTLRRLAKIGDTVQDIFDTAYMAGCELITTGSIPPRYLDTVSRELVSPDEYCQWTNTAFKAEISKQKEAFG